MFDSSKRKEITDFFDAQVNELLGAKVKSVFSIAPPSWTKAPPFRKYYIDSDVYILFDNGICCIINYLFPDSIEIDFRKLTEEEKELCENLILPDFFNGSQDIYRSCTDEEPERADVISLPYSEIEGIYLAPVKRIDGELVDCGIECESNPDSVIDQIRFKMSNGKCFTVTAGDGFDDGFVWVWSEDCEEKTVRY